MKIDLNRNFIRYQSAGKRKRNFRQCAGIYGIIGMLCVLLFLVSSSFPKPEEVNIITKKNYSQTGIFILYRKHKNSTNFN